MQDRPTCEKCSQKPCAINYKKGDKIYYRKMCDSCTRRTKNKKRIEKPRWELSGYKKLDKCEKCGFSAQYHEQLTVQFVDNNLNNTDWRNLKTVCQNCYIELKIKGVGWIRSDLVAD